MKTEFVRETQLIPAKWRRVRAHITERQLRQWAVEAGEAWVRRLREATSVHRWTYRELRRRPLFARAHPSGMDPALVSAHAETGARLSRGWYSTPSIEGPIAVATIGSTTPWARYFNAEPTKRMVGRPVTKRSWGEIREQRIALLQRLGLPIREK